jgi:hypothetical protein
MKFIYVLIMLTLVASVGAQTPPPGQKGKAATRQTQQVSDAKLKELETFYSTAKANFAKKPKDVKAKNAFINSTFAVGVGRMYSVSLPPRAKYSTALDAFREVLKLDPKHKGANENYNLIAGIYKQMGKPVPGEK